MLYILLSLSMMSSFMFLFLNHPLSMGFILLLQTILICLISGLMSTSFWFSYILLLIYLGGMLVLFMYITSLASNELFLYTNTMIVPIIMLPIIFTIFQYLMINYFNNSNENMELNHNINMYINNFLIKIYNSPINIMTILIATYLFLTLIAVVKIINIFKGPMRQMN
uniref:NADH dehydrogenase subunit 6 n=1 Tax=Callibia diana TaxID=1777913 RepID=UPI002551D141|nr:NADH dehydrogenase subunit 6 [Callibia diana]WFD61153.1 NADH dehydrogenase subunit 6 [Callibia diana]